MRNVKNKIEFIFRDDNTLLLSEKMTSNPGSQGLSRLIIGSKGHYSLLWSFCSPAQGSDG